MVLVVYIHEDRQSTALDFHTGCSKLRIHVAWMSGHGVGRVHVSSLSVGYRLYSNQYQHTLNQLQYSDHDDLTIDISHTL